MLATHAPYKAPPLRPRTIGRLLFVPGRNFAYPNLAGDSYKKASCDIHRAWIQPADSIAELLRRLRFGGSFTKRQYVLARPVERITVIRQTRTGVPCHDS